MTISIYELVKCLHLHLASKIKTVVNRYANLQTFSWLGTPT